MVCGIIVEARHVEIETTVSDMPYSVEICSDARGIALG
jgi:hypothetical protein